MNASRPIQSALFRAMLAAFLFQAPLALAQTTDKPVLHGRQWVAISGRPLATAAGARVFQQGGNGVDAACAMLAAVCTLHDDLGWGGETQALVYDPRSKKVHGINALGVAPTGATPEFFRRQRLRYPPGEGPLAALTPGTPGGLMVMLREYGKLSLKEVLTPAMELAEGYPMDEVTSAKIEAEKEQIKEWPSSRRVMLPHLGAEYEAPRPGEIFRQPELLGTLRKLVQAETDALAEGKSRAEAIDAAYHRFYKGDIAVEFVRGSKELGGLHTLEDLAGWKVYLEEPVMTTYKGVEIYKLTSWVQGPALLQMLNMAEHLDLAAMGLNSARYIHALAQIMQMALADRDFYYGDPYFPPQEPLKGILSKDYAQARLREINWTQNNPDTRPGDPYPFEGGTNPFVHLLRDWSNLGRGARRRSGAEMTPKERAAFHMGTTTIQAADREGWVVSMTPSGGWVPPCMAGDTGVAMSQRMQSFVLDVSENPFNVVAPGKRPRATLSPSLALRGGRPFLSFAVQGGDSQEQNQLQFFLNIVEFGLGVQEACEGPNFETFQVRASFERHEARPGHLTINDDVPWWVRRELQRMGYRIRSERRTSGPLTAIYFDQINGTFWGGASQFGPDYGLAW